MVLELKLNTKEQTLLLEALHTRLQRIEQIIEIFKKEDTIDAKLMVERYGNDYSDVKDILTTLQRTID